MTRDQMLALGGAAAIVLVLAWQAQTADKLAPVQGAVEGVTWKAGYPAGHEHLALPWDIGTVIWGPHPLYCGGNRMGQYRDPLIADGWATWIASNPEDATI